MGLRANPTYRQRRFGAEVRKLRERAGLTVGEAARLMEMHSPHLSNVEAGRTSLSAERLDMLAHEVEGTTATFLAALQTMGQESGRGWWSDYRKVLGASHVDLAEQESGAQALCNYELLFIPGLLQTREYATAVHGSGFSEAVREVQDRAIEFRLRRQLVLSGERPPRFHAIVHEAALRVLYGGRTVMRDQLLRLIQASRLPNVTIQIVPIDNEGSAAFSHPFMVIEPSVVELSTVLVDQFGGSEFLDDLDAVTDYRQSFQRLSELALPSIDAEAAPEARTGKDSLGLLQHILYPLL
ncbi:MULTISPECIES: helix-turn-helix transcriptional regulator [unclassified Streptomyces]|uniref:helix-turn-helix domain-containing protein n=1 Tax=unclassified Streptomyces TaxID=2593676 RepID=UPI00168AECEC|nr:MULTISPECIES: helix-turn-helix transcriptional regulator [unclassified Streptomyces]MBD3007827.1 helix-turn-helix transcriptional regulator [Streptomyces sp. 5-10]